MHPTDPDPLRAAALPPPALARIEQELARCVGPVAAMLVRRAAPRHASAQALVLALAPSIEVAADRAAFLRACGGQTAPRRDAADTAQRTETPPTPAAAAPAKPTARMPRRPTVLPAPPVVPPVRPEPAVPSAHDRPAARADRLQTAAAQAPAQQPPLAERRDRHAARAHTLSPHWRGVATRGHRDLALLPLWAAAAFAGVLLLASWLALSSRLDARARPLFARIAAIPSELHASTAAPAARPRLAVLLTAGPAPIEVRDEVQRSLVTLPADALFADGSARLDARADALLSRIAQALQPVHGSGELLVIGHGVAAAPSLQYPSNWHFTRARAKAVADALAVHGVSPARAEGRAEFEPRAGRDPLPNRIEIELRLARPDEALQP